MLPWAPCIIGGVLIKNKVCGVTQSCYINITYDNCFQIMISEMADWQPFLLKYNKTAMIARVITLKSAE